MIKHYTIKILVLLAFLPVLASASSISVSNQSTSTLNQGDEVRLDVFLNTEGDTINTVMGKLSIPRDVFEVKEVLNGNSAVTLWVEAPNTDDLSNTGSSTFAGIIPGGYRSERGYLFSIILKTRVAGKATIKLDDLNVIQNTADAKLERLANSNLQLGISREVGTYVISATTDEIAPENFRPLIAQDKDMFDGKYFAIFVTQDKGSGVDYFEVKEGRWGKYERGESPYILKNQNADSVLYIKAVDKAGNSRTVSIYGPEYKPWYERQAVLIILMFVFLAVVWRSVRPR